MKILNSIISTIQTVINRNRVKTKYKIHFIFFGAGSFIWFLIRVIPKPSRAAYPCMRATAPIASAFVLYLLGLSGIALLFKKAMSSFKKHKIIAGIALASVAMLLFLLHQIATPDKAIASANNPNEPGHLLPNQPIGEARGIFPGRVVWVHDPGATNPNFDPDAPGGEYWKDINTYQAKVDEMLKTGIRQITGATSEEAAWDSVFMYFNQKKGKGKIGYTAGEKIFIKLNATSTWTGNIKLSDFSRVNNDYYGIVETLPQIVTSVMDQLINEVGVPEENIYVGDPMKHIYQDNYNRWMALFPNVHYLDHDTEYDGREIVVPSATGKIVYSDSGKCIIEKEDYIYTVFEDADYVINLPSLKGHKYAGITAFAKNHFGSHTRPSASHLHKGLVHTATNGDYRTDYGTYRVLVDIMGHNLLSGKSLIYIMDAFYASYFELALPVKWEMEPFNGHWMSSLFLSFDPVAIESVGFDFLYTEFDGTNSYECYPHMGAVDDYLEQAASSDNWPAGITYAPNADGIPIPSLGVHEHWDSPQSKKYSRNLGTGNGIELQYISMLPSGREELYNITVNAYPNPFTNNITFSSNNGQSQTLTLVIFTLEGKQALQVTFNHSYTWNGQMASGEYIAPGTYIYKISSGETTLQTGKVVFNP